MAEDLEKRFGRLCYTVLKPRENTAAALKAVHASFMRRALAPAGIWTVETGELFGGLHLNILSPEPRAARWKCVTYSELVQNSAREAGAYIAKRDGIPARQQYGGRLYGSWGQVGALLVSRSVPVVVQAAALEVVLGGGDMRNEQEYQSDEYMRNAQKQGEWVEGVDKRGFPVWRDGSGRAVRVPPQKVERTKEEYREIAFRNLAKLRGGV